MLGAAGAAAFASVLCLGVAWHENAYRNDHPHAAGVAGVLIVLAVAGALVSGAVAWVAWSLAKEREARFHARVRAAMPSDDERYSNSTL